jgi:hypothetical protein
MSDFNKHKMEDIADDVIKVLKTCLANKEVWKNDKQEIIKIIKNNNFEFYEKYPRICRTLAYENDITPLIGMISQFAKVQNGELSINRANDLISGALNEKYVDPVLNSDKLVQEREEKDKAGKVKEIN